MPDKVHHTSQGIWISGHNAVPFIFDQDVRCAGKLADFQQVLFREPFPGNEMRYFKVRKDAYAPTHAAREKADLNILGSAAS
jgi:hypothetical protein